ncbi:MAG: LolA-related protein [Pseudomonadota bacterium]|jgi:uncharacterized protein (UPF0548 family)
MAAESLEELMAAFTTRQETAARFEEERHLSALASPVVLRGRLQFTAPDRLIKVVETPVREDYVLEKNTLTIERDGKLSRIDIDTHPALRAIAEAFRATLSGDLASLRRYFEVRFSKQGQDAWSLELTPLDRRVADQVERLSLQGRGALLLRAVTHERGGDQSDMRIIPL